jgi:hypothetical protein
MTGAVGLIVGAIPAYSSAASAMRRKAGAPTRPPYFGPFDGESTTTRIV